MKRTDVNKAFKGILAVAMASAGLWASAQTQNIPIPASSAYSGKWAAVAITIPPPTVLPSNLCTSSNNNCITSASLPEAVKPLISNQGSVVSLYQTVVSTGYYGYSYPVLIACIAGNQRYPYIYIPNLRGYAPELCPSGSAGEMVYYGNAVPNWRENDGQGQ